MIKYFDYIACILFFFLHAALLFSPAFHSTNRFVIHKLMTFIVLLISLYLYNDNKELDMTDLMYT